MPLLIDGNNLLHALLKRGVEVGRGGLVTMLAKLASPKQHIRVVFDGPEPDEGARLQMQLPYLAAEFSGRQKADAIIVRRIAEESAPRRLTVVSTDHEIRQAARRRDCPTLASEEFAPHVLHAPPPGGDLAEPPEKTQGTSGEQTQQWLREFGLDQEDQEGRGPDEAQDS